MSTKGFVIVSWLMLGLLLSLVWLTAAAASTAPGQADTVLAQTPVPRKSDVLGEPIAPAVVRGQGAAPGSAGIVNGDFENGSDGSWQEYSQVGWTLIVSSEALSEVEVTPHGGNWLAWMSTDDETAYISQTVPVLAGDTALRFWIWTMSEETACTDDYGWLSIGGTEIQRWPLCTATDSGGWIQKTINMAAYISQTVSLQIGVWTDPDLLYSSLFVDDVAFANVVMRSIYLPLVVRN